MTTAIAEDMRRAVSGILREHGLSDAARRRSLLRLQNRHPHLSRAEALSIIPGIVLDTILADPAWFW